MRASALVSFATLILSAAVGECQPRVTVQVVKRSPLPPDQIDSVLSQIRYLDAAKWDSPRNEAVDSVIAGGRAVFRDYFVCPLSDRVEAKLVPLKGEPILAARWPDGCGPSIREVRIWDEPTLVTFFLRLPAETTHSSDALAKSIDGVFQWEIRNPMVGFISLSLSLFHPPSQPIWIAEGKPAIHTIPIQFPGVGTFVAVWVHGDANGAWLSVTIGKWFLERYYSPETLWILERFPPLRSRVPSWSNEKLIEQTRGLTCFSETEEVRCPILIAELVKRDLSHADFRQIISGVSADYFLKEFAKTHALGLYRQELFGRLRELAGGPFRWGGMVPPPSFESLLGILGGAPGVDPASAVEDLFRSGWRRPGICLKMADQINRLGDAYDCVQVLSTDFAYSLSSKSVKAMVERTHLTSPSKSKVVELLDVDFERGKSTFPITAPQRQAGFERLKHGMDSERFQVVIEGHAAPDEGDADACLLLASKRADAVKAALIQAGVPADRLKIANYGSARPFCIDTDPQRACDAWNRRVHFTYEDGAAASR